MDVKIQNEPEIRYAANFKEIEEISHIDSLSFHNHYRKEHLEKILRNKKAFALVALDQGKIIGYIIYYVDKNHYVICRMAVDPNHRRTGCGKALLNKVVSKLSPLRKHVEIIIKESNVIAQQFFKSLNFNATKIYKDNFITYHDDLPSVPYIEDGILFKYTI